MANENKIYGALAQFNTPEELMAAARKTREAGYKRFDTYSPFPIHGMDEAMGIRGTLLPWLVFIAGVMGAVVGFGVQYWTGAISYPINIGGRPLLSLPAFIPIIFECTILFAAFMAVFGMLIFNGLPRLFHPVFHVEAFELASRDKFFLCIEARDGQFELEKTKTLLESLKPEKVYEVPV